MSRLPRWRQQQINNQEAASIADYYDRHPFNEETDKEIEQAIKEANRNRPSPVPKPKPVQRSTSRKDPMSKWHRLFGS